MKLDEAMLLPNVYKEFKSEVFANISQFPHAKSLSENELPNSHWLLSQFHVYFENTIQCRHKRYGTLLYHNSCDVIKALSTALGKTHTHTENRASNESQKCTPCICTGTCPSTSIEEQVQTIAVYFNRKLQEQAKDINTSFETNSHSLSSLDVATYMKNTDQGLLKFLATMAQSVRQSKRKLFETDTQVKTHLNIKDIRLFYALSVLQFCTNTTCSAPLHILITEAVLCNGGTLELVHILNQLGAAASVETANRLATHVALPQE